MASVRAGGPVPGLQVDAGWALRDMPEQALCGSGSGLRGLRQIQGVLHLPGQSDGDENKATTQREARLNMLEQQPAPGSVSSSELLRIFDKMRREILDRLPLLIGQADAIQKVARACQGITGFRKWIRDDVPADRVIVLFGEGMDVEAVIVLVDQPVED